MLGVKLCVGNDVYIPIAVMQYYGDLVKKQMVSWLTVIF